jgi:hypothetical protein
MIIAARSSIGEIPRIRSGWQLERSAKILKPIETLFDDVDACGVAQPNGAIITKGCSGDDGDIRFTQESIGKILRSQTELADIDQHIKGTLRFHRCNIWNLRDAIEHIIAAHIEFIAHVRDRLLVSL